MTQHGALGSACLRVLDRRKIADTDEDFPLIKQSQGGDQQAFRRLVEKYQNQVFRAAYALMGNREDADDIAQEVFIRAYRALPGFQFRSKVYTWLYRITVNCCLDEAERRNRLSWISLEQILERGMDLDELLGRAARSPEDALSDVELEAAIQEMLRTLSPEYRTIIVLREMEVLAYEEIAQVLDCSMGTVKSRLFRARSELRKRLISVYEDWRG